MSGTNNAPPPPPAEARLIRRAREARGLNPEDAAARVPLRLGGGRWRQIEKGYERLTPLKAVKARPTTLAHMAHAVGVTPERLAEAGRTDAADILREIEHQEQRRTDREPTPYADMSDSTERALWSLDISEADRIEMIDIYRRGRQRKRRSA